MTSSQHLDALRIIRWQRRDLPTVMHHPKVMIITDTAFTVQDDQLLTAMLKAIRLERSDVHISDNPQDVEEEINSVKPALILSFSNIVPSLKNQIPLIHTYHPAHLLRNPLDKAKAYQDLKFALTR